MNASIVLAFLFWGYLGVRGLCIVQVFMGAQIVQVFIDYQGMCAQFTVHDCA